MRTALAVSPTIQGHSLVGSPLGYVNKLLLQKNIYKNILIKIKLIVLVVLFLVEYYDFNNVYNKINMEKCIMIVFSFYV